MTEVVKFEQSEFQDDEMVCYCFQYTRNDIDSGGSVFPFRVAYSPVCPSRFPRESEISGFCSLHGCWGCGGIPHFHTSASIFYDRDNYRRSHGLLSRIFGFKFFMLI